MNTSKAEGGTQAAVKERPILFSAPMVRAILDGRKTQTRRVMNSFPCPYGAPGERLWVRENFAKNIPGCEEQKGLSFQADHKDPRGDGPANPMRWTPSIHMPRWASRITLEVTGVRAERLNAMSEADALAEGLFQWVDPKDQKKYYGITLADVWETDPRQTFKRLWDSLNKERGFGWDVNPWVWVVEFKRL